MSCRPSKWSCILSPCCPLPLSCRLPSSLHRRFCLLRCAAAAFLVAPPLPSSSHRRFCLRLRAAGSAFVVAPPLPSLSRKRCLPCGAAAPFIVAPPLPSSSPPLIVAWFCLCRRAAAAFLVAPPPLPSLSRRRSPHRRAPGSAFVVVPSVALLPLAVVVPRRRAAHHRCVLPVAVVMRPSKLLYCVAQYCLKYCSPLVDGRFT